MRCIARRSSPGRRVVALAVSLGALTPTAGHAQSEDDAETLFTRGRALAAAGRCGEALPLFRQSHQRAPAVGTLLNVGVCEEAEDRTASAARAFEEARALASSLGDEARKKYAAERLASLRPQLRRLRVVVRTPTKGLVVRLDGRVLAAPDWGRAIPLDAGEHRIAARAQGHHDYEAKVTLSEPGTTLQLEVPALTSTTAPAPPPAIVIRRERGFGSAPKIAGWAVGGVGLVAVGVGVGLALRADEIVERARPLCPDADNACLPEGVRLRNEAQTNERAGIALLAVGGAALTTGAVLLGLGYASGPDDDDDDRLLDRMAAAPWFDPTGGGGLTVRGSF
ncbi:MAG: hypothetical protein AAF928_19295 [Myxococcota bacterium]